MESPLCPPVEPGFRLIETLAYWPDQGFMRLDRHLNRMARSAFELGLSFSEDMAARSLSRVSGDDRLRCRLTMNASGQFEVTTAPLAENPPVWRLAIAGTRLSSSDFWLRHKTTRRGVYDNARAAMQDGVDELLFLNERDELCEGSITNLFIQSADSKYFTPDVSSGLLPGILREEMLQNDEVAEATLTLTDLRNARSVYMGNSLRGLISVELVNQ